MLPAAGLEIPDACAFRNLDAIVNTRDLTDALDLNAINSPREARDVLRRAPVHDVEIVPAGVLVETLMTAASDGGRLASLAGRPWPYPSGELPCAVTLQHLLLDRPGVVRC